MMEEILLEGDVQFSATSGATVTASSTSFFRQTYDALLYILNGFSLVGSGTGGFFSLRNDIAMKSMLLAKDIYFYAQEGIKIKIKNGWFEEPPQLENRPGFIKE